MLQKLIQQGLLTEAQANILRKHRIVSTLQMQQLGANELSSILRIPTPDAQTLLNLLSNQTEETFKSSKELLNVRRRVKRLSTGSKNLDELLGGGIETGSLTEVAGAPGMGKTQIGFQLAINVAKPKNQGGLGENVLFIDTEHTYRPDRIMEMCINQNLDAEDVLSRIFVAQAYNSTHQEALVQYAIQKYHEKPARLMIIDSLTNLYRSDFTGGKDAIIERQQQLNKHIRDILEHAALTNTAVYVTNQVQHSNDASFGDFNKPSGGHIVGHASTHRLYLHRDRNNKHRIARLIDSPNLPEGQCTFTIDKEGVQ